MHDTAHQNDATCFSNKDSEIFEPKQAMINKYLSLVYLLLTIQSFTTNLITWNLVFLLLILSFGTYHLPKNKEGIQGMSCAFMILKKNYFIPSLPGADFSWRYWTSRHVVFFRVTFYGIRQCFQIWCLMSCFFLCLFPTIPLSTRGSIFCSLLSMPLLEPGRGSEGG